MTPLPFGSLRGPWSSVVRDSDRTRWSATLWVLSGANRLTCTITHTPSHFVETLADSDPWSCLTETNAHHEGELDNATRLLQRPGRVHGAPRAAVQHSSVGHRSSFLGGSTGDCRRDPSVQRTPSHLAFSEVPFPSSSRTVVSDIWLENSSHSPKQNLIEMYPNLPPLPLDLGAVGRPGRVTSVMEEERGL